MSKSHSSAFQVLLSASLFVILSSACTVKNVEMSEPSISGRPANAININTASKEELKSLAYIGEKLAAEIVEFREKNGRFHRPEQLLLLRGISEKRFREIRPYIATE